MAIPKKLFIFLGLLFALVLLISSSVAASSEQESTESMETSGHVVDSDHHGDRYRRPPYYPPRGPRCRYGCCRGYRYQGGCKRCCASAHEVPDAQFEDDIKN